MPSLTCPSCGVSAGAPDAFQGRKVRCGRCGKTFVAQAAPRGPAPPRSPSLLADTTAGPGRFPPPGQPTRRGAASEGLFGAGAPGQEAQGPLSLQGLKVRPLCSITLGDFQISRKLGSGTMGAVYLARQRSLSREVALKVLFRHLALQPTFVERFYREAFALARLDHPGIVRIHGVGETKGFHCMAMEFVKGINVAELQAQLGGRLRVGDALYVTLRCAEALQHAHEQRLAHRDVKPQNILVSQLGQVKLTDLGLAKPLDEDLSLTDSGLGVGTPHYMAPEQALDSKRADHRCDIYALGVVLYGLLTGQLPFQGESALELLRAKEQGFFRPARRLNPEVPSRLDLILDKMLAADLRCRYPSCAEVAGDLRRLGLANEHLSFNVFSLGRARPPAPSAPDERVEILLIHDDPEAILLAEEALQEDGVPSNLTIVESGAEFPLFLRREGPYVSAPRPDLIFLGLDLTLPVNREVLMAVQSEEALRCVPLIILSSAADPAAELEACGVRAALCISRPHDLERFRELLRADGGLAVTVLARWP